MSRIRFTIALALALALSPAPFAREKDSRSEAYREAQEALNDGEWDEAARLFAKLASSGGDEADAALYWKAYADAKRNRKKEALEGVRQLLSSYPQSPWVDDAKALELKLRDAKSATLAADATSAKNDEELKLYAIDALMQVDAEQAVPVLERILAQPASKKMKERALFVLSQNDSPRAREVLVRTAKSGEPIALRCEAVKTLGIAGDAENIAALGTIARDTSAPREVRFAVIEAYLIAHRPNEMIGIATSDPDPRVRARAIESLGAMGAHASLRQLWGTEKDPALRGKLLEAFGVAGDVDTLAKAARDSSEPRLRRKAIEGLAIVHGPAAQRELRRMYAEFTDPQDKRKVVEALMVQGDAKVLVEMFRAEKDPEMKRVILQQLSVMNDPEVTRIIMEILGDKP